MLLSLEGDCIAYSGADLEAIAQQLATQWINSKQRGLNLQNLQDERWKLIVRHGSKGVADWMREQGSGGLIVMTNCVGDDGLAVQRPKRIKPEELEEEAEKLHALCWENGFRPNEDGLDLIVQRFSKLIEGHLDKAVADRKHGRIKPPKPAFEERSTTWQGLLKAKEEEGIAPGTGPTESQVQSDWRSPAGAGSMGTALVPCLRFHRVLI